MIMYVRLCLTGLLVVIVSGCGGSSAGSTTRGDADTSVARMWSDVLLSAIRDDFARPTVHARNLFHVSAAVYDAWAAYAEIEAAYLLGKEPLCSFDGVASPNNVEAAREEAISYAAYRLIVHRFDRSPGSARILQNSSALMQRLNYDASDTSLDYGSGAAAAMGNYIADCYIRYGLSDGANEINEYGNTVYQPVNPVIEPQKPGNPNIRDLNRWQPISLEVFIDQAGNPVNSDPEFLSPEWGRVKPFALTTDDLRLYEREGFEYWVYHDPGMPPAFNGELAEQYKWNFALVAAWSSHLDPASAVTIDISPAAIGNLDIGQFPRQFSAFDSFYRFAEGGDVSAGHALNPVTGVPYSPQVVRLGDYTRVLAEFWADGPDSETPPGHWFVLLNQVSDHPLLERRFAGVGEVLGALEWDVKSYFALGGAMHDAAIAAWGVKGWYDYIRPLSAIRAMAELGQSSRPELDSFHVDGLPLIENFIALVDAGEPLAGAGNEHVGKLKLYAWRGPDAIDDPQTDIAGVGWMLAENWWPYQRPTFVTPPFAGYVSGHSTYSRAAAEILTDLSGSPFFPGGMGEFDIKANDFLVFERGPSQDMTLQWATYRDAADQCSLSRIWGGIHPPADDLPGRIMGERIGKNAFNAAQNLFLGN